MGIAVQLLWSGLTINRYQASLELLTVPLRTGTTVGYYSSQMFDHLFRGSFFNTANSSLHEEERIRQSLTDMRTKLTSLRTIVFNARKGLSQDELGRITKSEFLIKDFEGQDKKVNFLEAVHLYNMAYTIVLSSNLTELQSDRRVLDFLESNRYSDIPIVWGDACNNILDIQAESADRVQLIEFAFMVSAIALSALVLLGIFLPSVFYTLKQKKEVFILFERMEIGNLKDTIAQCKTRLCELEGVEQTTNNLDVQDALEMANGSKKAAKMMTDKGDKVTVKPTSKLKISAGRVCVNIEVLKMAALVVVTTGYFAGFYLWWLNARATLFDDIDNRVLLSRNRNWYSNKLVQSISGWDNVTNTVKVDMQGAEAFENLIWTVTNALYYGNPEMNITTDIRVMEGGEAMFSGNVCDMFRQKKTQVYSQTPCEDFYNSVMTRGGYEVYISYIALAEDLRRTYASEGVDAAMSRIRELKIFGDTWIPAFSQVFDDWLFSVFLNGFTNASTIRTIGTVIYVFVCTLLGGFIYYPMIRSINLDMQITRNLLTIIPTEILESSEALKEQVRVIALRLIQNQ
jgi:hypothetical protein